jgi:protein-arginine kinase activator protein McsA
MTKTKSRSRYIPKHVKEAVRRRDRDVCQDCGNRSEYMEFDHITPFSKGAPSTVENLQLLCRKCNQVKRNKTPECEKCKDWIPYGAKFCQSCGKVQKKIVKNYGQNPKQSNLIYRFIGLAMILFSLYLLLK